MSVYHKVSLSQRFYVRWFSFALGSLTTLQKASLLMYLIFMVLCCCIG